MYCLRWQQSAIFTEKKSPKTLAQQHSEQLVGAPADHLATKEPDISPRSQKKHTTVKKESEYWIEICQVAGETTQNGS